MQGYSEIMPKLIENIYKSIYSMKIEQQYFDLVKEDKNNSLKDQTKDTLYKQGFVLVKKVLRSFYHSPKELMESVSNISISDLESFKGSFLNSVRVQGLFLGNLLNTTAQNTIINMKSSMNLSNENFLLNSFKENITNINGKNLVHRTINQNDKDNNNLAMNYYQLGLHSLENYTKLWLLENTLNNEAFSYLRSELQLGYIAFGSLSSSAHVDGFVYIVQGVEKTPDVFDKHIEELTFRLEEKLKNMTKEEFQGLKASALASLREREKSLEERTETFWDELRNDLNEFGKKERMAFYVEQFTQEQLLSFYKQFFGKVAGKLSIQVYNQQLANNETKKVLEDYPLLKENTTYSGKNETLIQNFEELMKLDRYPAPNVNPQFP
jgi:insulysin